MHLLIVQTFESYGVTFTCCPVKYVPFYLIIYPVSGGNAIDGGFRLQGPAILWYLSHFYLKSLFSRDVLNLKIMSAGDSDLGPDKSTVYLKKQTSLEKPRKLPTESFKVGLNW